MIRIWARTLALLAGYVYHYSGNSSVYALLYAEELPDKLQTLISPKKKVFETCQNDKLHLESNTFILYYYYRYFIIVTVRHCKLIIASC